MFYGTYDGEDMFWIIFCYNSCESFHLLSFVIVSCCCGKEGSNLDWFSDQGDVTIWNIPVPIERVKIPNTIFSNDDIIKGFFFRPWGNLGGILDYSRTYTRSIVYTTYAIMRIIIEWLWWYNPNTTVMKQELFLLHMLLLFHSRTNTLFKAINIVINFVW